MLKVTNLSIVLFVVALLFIFVKEIFATVGGPTYIERLSYSAHENALYYLVNNQGGRGCMPEVEKLNLATMERVEVMPCDKIEANYFTGGEFDQSGYDQFVQDTFKVLTSLPIISLSKNGVSAAVDYTGEHRFDEYNTGSDFRATIFQNGQKKGMINFIGCHKDQPHVFRGYMISGTDKMAMTISRVGDCFEGGYVKDDLYIIDGVDFQDTNAVRHPNSFSGPQVYQGDLVLFVQDIRTTANIFPGAKWKTDFIFLLGAFILSICFCMGYMVGRKARG